MFIKFTPLRDSAILPVVGLCLLATAAPQASATFTYFSGSRSIEADAVVYHGPAAGQWDQSTSYGVPDYPVMTRATQSTDLYPQSLRGGGFAQAVTDPLSSSSAASRIEFVFSTDVAVQFRLHVAGTMSSANPTTISLWRLDPVTQTETLISHATTAFSLMQTTTGALEAGHTYRLRANTSPVSMGGGSLPGELDEWGEWGFGTPFVPTPGGVGLIAPIAAFSLRRRRA